MGDRGEVMHEVRRRTRIAGGVALAALLAGATTLAPRVATATTQTKFASVSVAWASNPGFAGVADTATVTFGNEPYSTQSIGSTQVTFDTLAPSAVQVVQSSVPSGWSAQVVQTTPAAVRLTSVNGSPIAPGGSISVQVTVTPPAAGTVTLVPVDKQSNNFSGSGNDVIVDSTSGLTLTVVSLSLRFGQQPSTTLGQSLPGATTPYFAYFCNPVAVQLYNGATALKASGVAVTLNYGGTSNPGLYFGTKAVGSTGVTVNTDANGLATFGSCSAGVGATVVGTGFTLKASSAAAASPVTSTAFQVLQSCVGDCTTTNNSGTTGTSSTVDANGSGVFQIFTAFGQGVVLSCDSAVTLPGTPVDPLYAETQSTGTVSGTITLLFSKAVVQSLANNGTPLMPVCAGASEPFPAQGDPSTGLAWPGSTAFPYQGLLYDCGDATYIALVATGDYPVQLCVQSRTRLGGSREQIVVFASDLSDPSFW